MYICILFYNLQYMKAVSKNWKDIREWPFYFELNKLWIWQVRDKNNELFIQFTNCINTEDIENKFLNEYSKI